MNRIELLTLMQLAKGMRIASVTFLDREVLTYDDVMSQTVTRDRTYKPKPDVNAKTYHYKVLPGIALKVGDLAVAQARDTVALVAVTEIHTSLPPYADPNMRLRYIIGKVDRDAAEAIVAEENAILAQIMGAEVKSKLATFSASLGFDPASIAIPSLEGPKE
jgi:hypothetical protein